MPITQAFDRRSQAIAASIRRDLGCPPWDPFPLDELLSDLGVYTLNPSEIPGMSESSLQVLFGDGAESWAAVTSLCNEHTVVIFNPLLSRGKRRIAVTHEVAHILLIPDPPKESARGAEVGCSAVAGTMGFVKSRHSHREHPFDATNERPRPDRHRLR